MLHSLPAFLDELERRLIAGEDPVPLIGSLRWTDVIDWPRDLGEARRLRSRLESLNALINGLQAPIRATLLGLNQHASYKAMGGMEIPSTISVRIQDCI